MNMNMKLRDATVVMDTTGMATTVSLLKTAHVLMAAGKCLWGPYQDREDTASEWSRKNVFFFFQNFQLVYFSRTN